MGAASNSIMPGCLVVPDEPL